MQANIYPTQQGVKYSPQHKSVAIIHNPEHQREYEASKKRKNIAIGLYILALVSCVVLPLVAIVGLFIYAMSL